MLELGYVKTVLGGVERMLPIGLQSVKAMLRLGEVVGARLSGGIALGFRLFGESVLTIRIMESTLYLLIVATTVLLARQISGSIP